MSDKKLYERGIDFWRDTAASHGLEEAAGICSRYLSMQIKSDSDEERQFCRELFAAMMEDISGHADPAKLVYPYSFEAANERSEVSLYHENRDRNAYCAQAIDNKINASRFATYRYNLELAAMSVIQEHGFSRVNAVLAHNLQVHKQDGRYSRDNKEWAAGFALPDGAFDYAYLKAHPILLEDFTKYSRRLYEDVGAERFALPGAPEAGHSVQGYAISRSILFDNRRGFAIGHNTEAAAQHVCWQFTPNDGKRDFYWGHYFNTKKDAIDDYIARVMNQMIDGQAYEIGNSLAAVEMSTEQNYNMLDGTINNENPRLDLTDGQTYEEIQELTPETLSQEKSSVMEQIREAKKAPPTPYKDKGDHGHGGPDR